MENEHEMDMDDKDDVSSNDSNSPEAMSDEEEFDEMKIKEIQEQIKRNPYVYETHIQLITMLRKTGDLILLREAREEMSKIFPLTPELWLDWLTDEEKLAATDAEKEAVTALFERSVKDYTAVSLWLEYVQYAIGNMGANDGVENVRKLFERALTAVGIHAAQGALIWEAYREFELAMLTSMKAVESEQKQENEESEEIKEQKNRIVALFRRQLSVPLLDMDKTYEEYQNFIEGNVDSSVRQKYAKASAHLKRLKEYEDAIFHSEVPHLEEYKRYIEFEKKEGNPARVQCIYERALVENCLVPDLWQDYAKYLDSQVKIESVTLPVHERAVRNCPWSVSCWKNYLLALERHNQSFETVTSTFERALNAGFTSGEEYKVIWLAYLDYLRRRIKWDKDHDSDLKHLRQVFQRAAEHIMTYFKDSDPQCSILQYWAKVEAKYCKDVTRARTLWNDIMNNGHNSEAEMWLNYANFEKLFGDEKHYRRLLFKALYSASDWPESIGNVLLTFEREEGTLETLDIAVEKYESQMRRVQERRQRIAEKEALKQKLEEEHRAHLKAERKASKLAAIRSHHMSKSKSESPDAVDIHMDSEGFKIPPPPSRGQGSPESKDNRNRILAAALGKHKREAEPDVNSEVKKAKLEKEEEKEESSHGMKVEHDPSKDERTVFLSNLAYSTEEDKIKDMFSKVGEINEVRLVRDYKGRSKGYCYVVFSSISEAREALKKDREPLDGRPVFVSRCEDKKKSSASQSKFKFGMGLEKNKLFVKGLPFTTTKEDLAELFKEFGTLKEVRLVTYRNGHSKGLAYVEYENEASAATALVKTDGSKIGDHVISVAISNPPGRKPKANYSSSVTVSSSLGGGSSRDLGPRGRGRTQVTLLPRALQKPSAVQKLTKKDKTTFQNGDDSNATNSEPKNFSNDDFRNMLLNK